MDVDMDMDLDLTVDAPEENYNEELPEAPAHEAESTEKTSNAKINPFDGSVVGAGDIAFEKVHIRGLDRLDNQQIKNYVNTYFDSPHFQRIEWIDDTSANLVYDSASAASEALVAFTNTDLVDITQLDTLDLRPARTLQLTSPEGEVENHELQIRQATTSDVKKKGAHEASKFYLMNPDKDPREQRFRERRDRIRGNVENGDYRRMRFDEQERKRRHDEDTFDENMYDEPGAGTQSADDDDRRKRVRFGRRNDRDLFTTREKGRLRDRSASPIRFSDGDGRYGFGSDADAVRRRPPIRQRSLTPPRLANKNAGKELFATKSTGLGPAATVELFPNKTSVSGTLSAGGGGTHSHSSSIELFPDKIRKSHHRRSGAIDASPDRFLTNADNRSEGARSLAERISGGPSLADRISGRLSTASGGGSLADRITPRGGESLADRITRDDGAEISIRGSSGVSIKGRAEAESSFTIKGASSGNAGGVKELFPVKSGQGNAGKELFGEKLKGRGLARRTAASYF
ncbi:uncharacterized protein PV09_03778 [Verruconis gallopava]|uniref:Uncharacterized protein n=1 Tax=Verruconis gallopava TaxID=253628 RepID=A0A0D1YWZ1_9PEZI|nr:uncharacterized protein PV09_03778 [Verruconis gallopava]KIW05242.1 hypothetical protein PV09_03778 [Verruconis gallopava]